jgi:branched-chain amino acid transport system permease protein
MSFWVVNTLNGLSLAMILFVLSAGLTLAFGLMQIINMAHGSFYLLGGYIGLSVIQSSGSFSLGLLTAAAGVALLGALMQRYTLARLHKRQLPQSLLTLGLLFIFADLAFWLWGGDPQLLPEPGPLEGSVAVLGVNYPLYRLSLIGIGLAVALVLWILLERTRIGALVRAGMDDEEMVRAMGLNIPLIFTAVFAFGAGLAALGGVLGGPILGVFPGADFDVVLLAFVVVTVGGLGSIPGAFYASLLVGLVDNFGTAWFPQLSLFTVIVPMIIVLAVRPTGLMGRP